MTIEYTYDTVRNVVVTRPGRELSVAEMINYVDRLINDTSLEKRFIELVYFKDVEEFRWSYSQTNTILKLFLKLRESKQQLGAILLVNDKLQLGMARMIQTIFLDDIHIYIVNSEGEADSLIEEIQESGLP